MIPASQSEKERKQKLINITLAVLAGQVGCLTLAIVLAATLAGLWLDQRFQTKPTFTLILVLASVPISLVVMFLVARSATKRIKAQQALQEDHGVPKDK